MIPENKNQQNSPQISLYFCGKKDASPKCEEPPDPEGFLYLYFLSFHIKTAQKL